MRLPLAVAEKYAAKIIAELAPLCEPDPSAGSGQVRCVVAGSVRRRRPFVNDLDFVAIPRDYEAFRRRILEHCNPILHGDSNFSVETTTGIQLDFFLAQPDCPDMFFPARTNWGTVLVCRTGSTQHNIYLSQRAEELGLHWNPYRGVLNEERNIIASATEEDIFKALKLEFVPPEKREV